MSARPSSQSVDFRPLPVLPSQLAAHADFKTLYDQVAAIDTAIASAQSKRKKLKAVRETSAVHLTCLKQAQRIAIEQETADPANTQLWTRAMVAVVARAQEVMQRENVKEHFSHYTSPRVLRVLAGAARHYRRTLRTRADRMGIMGRDAIDLRFALEYWWLVRMEIAHEPHEDIVTEKECNENVEWLQAALNVAEAEAEATA